MALFSSVAQSATLLGATRGRAAEAESIAARARSATSATEVAGLKAGKANAGEASALLQVADAALTSISKKLASMQTLADDAKGAGLSDFDRAALNSEFADLRAEIDEIAQTTTFNGVNILQGNGPGTPYQVTFKVGTGNVANTDTFTISIASAVTADLNAGLGTDTLTSIAAATAAGADVTAATDALNAIRGAVAGNGERAFEAASSADDIGAGHDQARRRLVDVDVAIDGARILGDEIVRQGGLSVTDPEAALLRKLAVKTVSDESDGKDLAPTAPKKTPPAAPSSTPDISSASTEP